MITPHRRAISNCGKSDTGTGWLAIIALLMPAICGASGDVGNSEDFTRLPSLTSPLIHPIDMQEQEPWYPPGNLHGVDWEGLAWQSNFFLGVKHAFRIATEPGTRHGLSGPFLSGYLKSIASLRGWSDGDPFYVNYIGHPMQGAVSGFIWAQNDGDYRGVVFSRDRNYWRSRARAAAFSLLYSTLFEIGPVSEASIGKIQSSYPQYGLVDFAVTPVIGTGWMIAEDALDRFVIKPIERRVSNRYVRLLARGGLNPARSFSNLMRLRVPWMREDRRGVFRSRLPDAVYLARVERAQARELSPPILTGRFGLSTVEASVDFKPLYHLGNSGLEPCIGGGANGAIRLSYSWQFLMEVSGCKVTGLEENQSADTLLYTAGLRWSPIPTNRWSPYLQFRTGGMKVSHEVIDPELRDELLSRGRTGPRSAAADYELYATTQSSNGLAVSLGAGIEVRMHPAFALKLADFEYRRSWLPPVAGYTFDHGVSFTTGVVLRMGTW